jgi:hypothetical protein
MRPFVRHVAHLVIHPSVPLVNGDMALATHQVTNNAKMPGRPDTPTAARRW